MKRVLINGLKSRAGGGKNIFDNYVENLSSNPTNQMYFILTPNRNEYLKYSGNHITIVDVHSLFKINLLFPALYFFELKRVLGAFRIDLILNFGDVIIPTKIPQIYFFDWAYAVYPDKYIWKKMSIKDYLVRKTKVFLIQKYIHRVKLIIAQTENMAMRLRKFYKVSKVLVIPTPAGLQVTKRGDGKDFNLPSDKIKFLFPASFSSHKNFEILIPLRKLIDERKLPFLIILTLSQKEMNQLFGHNNVKNLGCIKTVGKVSSSDMTDLYKQSDALFFPTLLESFGLPYVEAMTYQKPILTSDLDFAHEVCGNMAYYFDPFDEKSILVTMENVFSNKHELQVRLQAGKDKVKKLPNWESVFLKFQQQINLLLN